MKHPVFGISYFVRLGAFCDTPFFVRRDIFAFAKVILRLWCSGILFAHTIAAGNITRRSRISLHRNRTRIRRIELKKHLHLQVLFLVGEDGFEPSKLKAADLQSVPFGHSGTLPYLSLLKNQLIGAGGRT